MPHDARFPQIESPNAHWASIAFGQVGELNSLVGRAAWSGYPDLRMERLSDGDEEVRVWGGPVLAPLQGTFLKKREGVWSAVRLLPAPPLTACFKLKRRYAAPQSGWPAF